MSNITSSSRYFRFEWVILFAIGQFRKVVIDPEDKGIVFREMYGMVRGRREREGVVEEVVEITPMYNEWDWWGGVCLL